MRKHYIDYLRSIAILAVVTIHVTGDVCGGFGNVGHLGRWLSNLLNSASRFAIPVFVMISGAVLLGKDVSVGEFYRKRSARLLPAIGFWTVFYIGFSVYQGETARDLLWFLKIGLLAEGCAAVHLWYLSMFACLMVFAPFINKFLNGDRPSSTDIATLLVVMFAFFLLNGTSRAAKEVLGIRMEWFKVFPWYIAYFIGGYYLDRYGQTINIRGSFMATCIAALILGGAVMDYYLVTSLGIVKESFIFEYTGPVVFGVSSFVFLLARNNAPALRENKMISAISEASFGIYLIHPVFLHIVRSKLPACDAMPLIYMPVSITLTMLGSLLSITLMRKIPFMRAVC